MHKLKMLSLLILGIAFSGGISQAQTYRNLIVEGGAMQGIAHIGALKVLDSAGYLDSMENVGGTSSGAIHAMMLAAGYSVLEIENIMAGLNWEDFNDGAYALMSGSLHLIQHLGWLPGNTLHNWLELLMYQKTGIHNISFRQLDSLKAFHPNIRNLRVIATNLNLLSPVELSLKYFPDMVISDAVYASCAIPFYFQPLIVDRNGKPIEDLTTAKDIHYLVDGCVMASFPHFLFKDLPGKTLNLLLDRPEKLMHVDTVANKYNFLEYTEVCYYAILESQHRGPYSDEIEKNSIHIGVGNTSPRIRKMRPDEIAVLVNEGESAARTFLKSR